MGRGVAAIAASMHLGLARRSISNQLLAPMFGRSSASLLYESVICVSMGDKVLYIEPLILRIC